jgi:transcriptional regulator with XRE-family HTH domain
MSQALASRLNAIKAKGGIKSRDVAQLLATTPQTISRWQTGKTAPQGDQLRKLLALEWLLDQLAELYTPDEAKLRLFSPHRLHPASGLKSHIASLPKYLSYLCFGPFPMVPGA